MRTGSCRVDEKRKACGTVFASRCRMRKEDASTGVAISVEVFFMWLKTMFADSSAELRRVRSLTMVAMLTALHLALNGVAVQLHPELRVGFGFLASAMVGLLYGPVPAMLSGAASDVLGFLLFPKTGDPYFPGFTLTAALAGLIYGLCLYHMQKPKIYRLVLAKGLVNLLCNVGLNSIWLAMLRGPASWVQLPVRLYKNGLLLPIEVLLLFVVADALRRVVAATQRR
jgi:ECF transporter S component (folate family)